MNIGHDWFGFVSIPDDLFSARSLFDHQLAHHGSNGCGVDEAEAFTLTASYSLPQSDEDWSCQARICTEQQSHDEGVNEYNHLRDESFGTALEDSCSFFEPGGTKMAECQNIPVQPSDTRERPSLLSRQDPTPSSTKLSCPIDSDGYVSASIDRKQKPECWSHGCNGFRFSTHSNLLRHMREKSGSSEKYPCGHCHTQFSRKEALFKHREHHKCKTRRKVSRKG